MYQLPFRIKMRKNILFLRTEKNFVKITSNKNSAITFDPKAW